MPFAEGVVESAAAKADQAALMAKSDRRIVNVDPTKIRPIDCRVLVRALAQSEMTAGGIIVPSGADQQRQLTMMEVVAVGDGRTTDHGVHIKVRVKPGDIVVIGKFAGSPVGRNEEYKIINEVEILAVQEI